MVENGHEKPAVWLMTECLRQIAASSRKSPDKHPSNIQWPDNLFKSLGRPPGARAVELRDLSYIDSDTVDSEAVFENNQFFRHSAGLEYGMLNKIWTALGRLVLRSADMKEDEAASIMSSVLLVLGHIHNLGMMPDDMYAYKSLPRSTFLQRPPILHLVSSRILTSMSDAAWRKQQDDAIAEATVRGMTLKQISETVPGGRFRLKVSPLAPEIWLELILWCCIEGGHRAAAVAIINSLRERHENPWFAVRWTASPHTDGPSPRVDWDRVKLRHGGTVGLIEGYSREKPFVDVPPRTVSVEVVLAVIESCVNSCHVASDRSSNFRDVDVTASDIENAIALLEPHDLPSQYIDFIGNRLMQTGAFDSAKSPATSLQKWAACLRNMQQLETIRNDTKLEPDLSIGSVLLHSLHLSGIQHQALDALVQLGDVHNSLQLFNDIQERVDQNKFRSITEFLQMQPAPAKGFFSPRLFVHRLEYTESHGQLPYHKLAAFLNLLSDTNMTGLGQWLLYADDIDGALIPSSAYGHPSMIAALLKFASLSQDDDLRHEVLRACRRSKLLPNVRVMRSLVDAMACVPDFAAVHTWLMKLKRAEGGGPGLSNIVHLAATILRLENGMLGSQESEEIQLEKACRILDDILKREKYGNVNRDFTLIQQNLFNQQVGHILRIFAFTNGSLLEHLARLHVNRYRTGNVVSLPASHFNVLLSAIVDVHGCATGFEMWNLFCQDFDAAKIARLSEIDDNDFDVKDRMPLIDAEGGKLPEHGKPRHGLLDTATETDADLPFENPLFPNSQPNGVLAPLLKPMSITTPNLQTARIIVRAAIKEKKALRREGKSTEKQDDILAWAYWVFKVFSAAENALIEQEIQEPVANLTEKIQKQIGMVRKRDLSNHPVLMRPIH